MRVLTVLGTRPEAIKLAPVIRELSNRVNRVESVVCVTAQHREMLDQALEWFGITADIDLNLMEPGQSLARFAGRSLEAVSAVMERISPDVVLVQGDTTTVMVAALAAFYHRIPVGHVEAGLRTRDIYNPFPEEVNRRVASVLATYHFAPTPRAGQALRDEGISESRIYVTGNTVIDALQWTLSRPVEVNADIPSDGTRIVLVTAHRRESFGSPIESVCLALRDIVERNLDVRVVYPVHLNPSVREPVFRILANCPRVSLIEPLRYEAFSHLMARSYLLVTDSGGIQEEAPSLGKPVLVVRETTERPEAVEAGAAMLVGTERHRIVGEVERLLHDPETYHRMANVLNPFGDGRAAERIVNMLTSACAEHAS